MKATFVALSMVGLVAAQGFGPQPPCAFPCLQEAFTRSGCGPQDIGCACRPDNRNRMLGFVTPCVASRCRPEDLGRAQAAANVVCNGGGLGGLGGPAGPGYPGGLGVPGGPGFPGGPGLPGALGFGGTSLLGPTPTAGIIPTGIIPTGTLANNAWVDPTGLGGINGFGGPGFNGGPGFGGPGGPGFFNSPTGFVGPTGWVGNGPLGVPTGPLLGSPTDFRFGLTTTRLPNGATVVSGSVARAVGNAHLFGAFAAVLAAVLIL
ncbi:hypothetical protein HIM_04712 [Hirsutella minnesotensis 3608]|uniref:CFEM domain-containing protein n=1 Tax=Hirsutella minnesotensis 3608 TaxID=1043627 RepID=A0A0F7ZV28_9HYPO|nr:hypothetical protein HIM_04712 [Hirsutella minnesotensis 3608]